MDLAFVDVLSRWVHIVSAIVLLGGAVFSRFVLLPAAAELSESEHDKLRAGVLVRWKRFVHLGIALLLATGIYNYLQAIEPHRYAKKLYHPLIGTKILLAIAVFFLASLLVGRTPAAVSMRKNSKRWIGVIVLLGLIIVAISSYAKVMLPGQPPAAAVSAPAE